jgi:hypothetical protein
MAKIKLNGDTSGYIEISAPAVSGNNTLELGPGTKILTNLDNTFTGVSTFSSDVYLGNDIYLTDGSSGYEKVEVDSNDIRVESKHIHSEFGVWTRSTSVNDRRLGIEGAGNDLLLYANSAEKVRIDSSGNLLLKTGEIDIQGGNKTVKTSAGFLQLGTSGSHHTAIITAGSERLRIGSDGHLSYKNSSPPAWSTDTGYANVTLGSSAYFRTDTDVNSNFFSLGSNAYRGSSNWQHVNSGWATQLQQSANDGDLTYRSSSTSGSANGTITWVEHLRVTSDGDVGIGENSPADRLVVQEANASGDVGVRIKNDTLTDGSSSTPTTASLYLNTSTGNFNSFYIQARRYDNDTHFGYSNPRDVGHTPNMIITNEGQIKTPKQPAFSVRRNGNQSIAHNTNTRVSWNTEIFDVGGNFDSSTNYRFTAPVAGKYLFLGHLYVYSTMQVEAKIYKNGSIYKRFSGPLGSGGNDNPNGIDFMDIIDLSVNDYIEIFAYHYRSGDTTTVDIYGGNEKETSFVGYLLG